MLRGYESLRLSLSGIKLASLKTSANRRQSDACIDYAEVQPSLCRLNAAFHALSSLSLNASPHRP